ncbi:unnamed protein product [Trichobilharzia regenti]|nr:unnamed protein product [Trichobilharzia regenti]
MLKVAGKAAGPDGISGEALKMDPETTADLMTALLEKVWEEGKVPKDFEKRILIQTTKEGRLKSLQNLVRNYASIYPKQNSKPHHPGENQARRPG